MKINAMRLGAAAVVLATGATLMGGAGAQAANLGGLSLNPASDTTTNDLPSPAPNGTCPSTATNFIVKMFGVGLPSAGVNLIGNTSLANANGAQFQNSFMKVFTNANIQQPNGTYTVSWRCTDTTGTANDGTFNSNVTFTHASTQGSFDASWTSTPAAADSATTLTVPASSTFGSSVTFTANVAPTAGASGTPAGTVQFMDGSATLGAPQNVVSGAASYTTSALTGGSHTITAVYSSSDANFAGSTSAASTINVAQAATSVSLTAGPNPSSQYQQVSFVAAVTPNTIGGSVAFTLDGGSSPVATVAVSGGSATYSTSSLTPGTHSVTAVFTPTDTADYSASPASAPASETVNAFSGVQAAQPITVNVPAGSLAIAIGNYTDDSVAGGSTGTGSTATHVTSQPAGAVQTVDLGTAAMRADGQFFEATGSLNNVTITDTRASNPGWAASGVVSDFSLVGAPAKAGEPATISGANLGWSPTLVTLSANQGPIGGAGAVVAGALVAPGNLPTGATVGSQGLATAKTFAVATAGKGNGAAVVAGGLDLTIPTDVSFGQYNATLTFTVM